MKELKEFVCLDGTPTDVELSEGLHQAKTNKCIVRISWKAFGSPYCIDIFETDTLADCKDKLPKMYVL